MQGHATKLPTVIAIIRRLPARSLALVRVTVVEDSEDVGAQLEAKFVAIMKSATAGG